MHSAPEGPWDPEPPFKHASPLPPPNPPTSRLTHVTTAAPAKRITFYKSGDSQFGGIRMAIHKRTFKCFDALLDDLSQKVPLPFGVRTVTTPRGVHNIKHLEQLQDGGCYLCSDRRQVKPINMELAGKRPAIWHHHSRRPQRPEAPSTAPPGHVPYRHRRILLVKNSEPGVRRSVVLSRRSTRSLKAFLGEVSEVMQFHVRKLYTVEGHKIDSVQSLMTCPGVLVCVGRELFSPLLVDLLRKSSEEKLPGLGPRTPGNGARSPAQGARSPPHGARSRASEYSEGHDSKKNIKFGLETKKSIIHPRSDSSNPSTRFSLSSDKSYTNGLSTCFHSQARPAIVNDDIEKRVLVNKDGSLSVEMRVRFRLQNDETLQWSTQIKKDPCLTNDSCPMSQDQPRYLQQGQSGSYSDPDSTSFDPEGADYANQPLQRTLEENHCPCCYQRQEQHYDLWENPAHSHKWPAVPPPRAPRQTNTRVRHTHSSSSSSSCHSRRVVRRRARLSDCGGVSGSEQDEVVQEMCVTEEVQRTVEVEQDGDTHVEVCKISRCCSCSEVTATDSKLRHHGRKSTEDERSKGGASNCKSPRDELIMSEGEERSLSAVSCSSHVLQVLQEDQDDEEDDLPPSASQCCRSSEPSPSSNVPATPPSVVGGDEVDRATSQASCRATKARTLNSEEEGGADDEDEEVKERVVSGLSGHTVLSAGSGQSGACSACPHCGGWKASATSDHRAKESSSRASRRSHHSHPVTPKPASPLSNQDNANDISEDGQAASSMSDGSDGSAMSTQSNKSNLTHHGQFSAMSNGLEGRSASAMSRASNQLKRSLSPTPAEELTETAGEEEERAQSATSDINHGSSRSQFGSSDSTRTKASERAVSPRSETAEDTTSAERPKERAASALSVTSAKSNVSAKSSRSHKSTCSQCARAVSPGPKTADAPVKDTTDRDEVQKEEGKETEERAASTMSAKSNLSAKSNKSHKSTKVLERSLSPRSEPVEDGEERAASAMSAKSAKSNISAKSAKSCRSICNGNARATSPSSKVAEGGDEMEKEKVGGETQERSTSSMSAKSTKSNGSHKSSCNDSAQAVSPNGDEGGADGEEVGEKTEEVNENEERTASAMSSKSIASIKSNKSHKSNCAGNTRASSKIEGDNTEEGEKAEGEDTSQERAASTLSDKSAKSKMSAKSHKSKRSRVASPAKHTVEADVDSIMERASSTVSGKSSTSAKSSKSHKSNCTAADVCTIDTNGEEKQDEKQVAPAEPAEDRPTSIVSVRTGERAASAMSVKSHSSVKSGISHKSNCNSPNTADIANMETPEGVDEEGKKTTEERAESTMSAKSGKSNVSAARSHTSNCNGTSDIPVIETIGADEEEEVVEKSAPSIISSKTTSTIKAKPSRDEEVGRPNSALSESKSVRTLSPNKARSPRSASPRASSSLKAPAPSLRTPQQLLPGPGDGETRGPSSLSGQSTSSTKSNRSKCCCGASSALQKVKKEVNEEEKELKSEEEKEASQRAGTKQLLSHASSGSISLGLPEDQEEETPDLDCGKSQMSSHTQSKSRAKTGRTGSDISAKTQGPVKSTMSKKSNYNGTLSPNPKPVNIPTIATTGGDEESEEMGRQTTERAVSALSAKSNSSVKSSRSHKSSCNGVKAAPPKPASLRKELHASASPRPVSQAKGKDNITDQKVTGVCSKSPSRLSPESAASAHSGTKLKASKEGEGEERSDCNSSNPDVESHTVKSNSVSKRTSPCPSHASKPCTKVETSSESALYHSAADLLREAMAARPLSRQSKGSAASKKTSSAKSGRCHRNRNQKEQEKELELTPACLPNSSPNEVVSDWLRSIPVNSCMLTLGDELNEGEEKGKEVEEEAGEKATKEEENPEDVQVEEEEEEETVAKVEIEEDEEEEKEEQAEGDAVEEEEKSDAVPPGAEGQPTALFFPRNCHSSVAVMKVLLSPSLGRCHSLPEVSPVYGRRLSTSAKGLLDCLAQLHLSEPAVSPACDQRKDHNECYDEIMAILQSLWLTEPKGKEDKDACKDQVTPPRSSSGVDMSSGSGGSGKGNGNEGGNETPPKPTAFIHEEEGAEGDAEPGGEKTAAEVASNPTLPETDVTCQELSRAAEEPKRGVVLPCLDSPKATETPSSLDKSSANDSSKSPTDNSGETLEDSSSGSPPTVLRAPLMKRPSQDPDPVWVLHLLKKLEKQFMNHYTNAMTEFKVRWDLDDSVVLDAMISELREEVSRRIQRSIDSELSKIKGRAGRSPRPPQGGNLSRESTMTDRRRRMLKVMKNQSVKTGDSLSDEEMMGEFSDQRSDDEYCPCDACVRKKMAARPPKMHPAAAPAPVMMEFDLLKILQLRKDPVSKPAASPEPVERKGDTAAVDEERNLEVVQEEDEEGETKEDIKPDVVLEETIPEEDEEEGKETEREEEEGDTAERETGKEMEGGVEEEGEEDEAMEEVVAEQENEEEDEGEAENNEGDEVQEEGETREDAGEEEASENGQEEAEEEEEAECKHHAAGNEGESDKTVEGEEGKEEEAEETSENSGEEEVADDGERAEEEGETGEGETRDNEEETGTGEEEEEESDKDTSRGETGGEGEGEEEANEEEEGEVEECVVSEFKLEEGETAGRESGEDEVSGETEDDNAAKTNEEESTLVEDNAEGNASASAEAEDEDDGDDSAGVGDSDQDKKAQEAEASEEETDSPQVRDGTPAATEGEEADAEDSDTDSKRPSEASAGDGDEKGGGGDGEQVAEDMEEKDEEEEGDGENVEARKNKGEETALPHQHTRTSVESQPGSMEAIDAVSTHVEVQETVPKMAAGVSTGEGAPCKGQRRSRSPARVKRRKPNVELDDLEL